MLEQAAESRGRFVLLAVLIPVLVALLTPFWLVFSQLASDPAARAILAGRPLIGVQLLAGLALLIWIFGWPLAHLCRSLARRRVTIDGALVRSDAVGLFAASSWTEPLAHYAGLSHRVRTSLSGVRQELILVHPRGSRSVVLQSAPQISRDAVETAARLFALAEIPSREAASLMPVHGYSRLSEPQPAAAGL
ncbi:hypothetical protein [Hyphomicrobium sp.]|uniref:hypothetical protein n=1 Tax=Hyphomicrobium sp. TaxID=82 RepID=UPI0025C6EA54|nr:hypothetical protein [Hyphomicrobium sp.]MCC7253740.1 hypothetical protein [Hyphomicrobium sp.]